MAGTQVSMQRKSVVASGTTRYEISTACTVRGTLPDTNIFLLTILTADDPKDDTFSRVCNTADFTEYQTNRDAAVDDADGSWRSSSMTLSYTDVEVANAAWKELSSRINSLVENYDAFLEDFETFDEGEVISYPTADESTKTALKDAYYAADTALTEAQDAVTEKTEECSSDDEEVAEIEADLQQAQSDLTQALRIQATVNACNVSYVSIHTALFANNTSLRSAITLSDATETQQAGMLSTLSQNDAQLNVFTTQNTALSGAITDITSQVSTLQARVTSLQQAKNTALVDLNKCSTEIARLQAASTAAQEKREAALAAVLAICPDFVP
jgi:peptidoglycan hydrolase CwlO-like protein